jgi:hypothetical protein
MKNALAAKRSVAVLTATLVVLSGCAAVQRQSSHDAAGLLKSAGFIANATPDAEKEFDVGALPAQQLVARNAAGNTVYLFSDPYECRCVYVGGAKEYAELQRLRAQRIADHEKAVQQTQAESDSRLGGAWNPKGLQVKP